MAGTSFRPIKRQNQGDTLDKILQAVKLTCVYRSNYTPMVYLLPHPLCASSRPIFEPITRLTRAYCQIIMPEWWECHECESVNNPHLTPDACLACGHFRCGYCRRRGPSVGRTGVSNSGRKTHNLSEQNAASPGAGAKEAQEQAQEQVQGRKLP